MRPCVLESPWRSVTVQVRESVLRYAIRELLSEGWAPFASHAIYTRALDEKTDRLLGLSAGMAVTESIMSDLGSRMFFYLPYGFELSQSEGMLNMKAEADANEWPYEIRRIPLDKLGVFGT